MELNEIGIAIRQARTRRGMTQKSLADACGLSRATINALEAGKIQELGFSRVNTLSSFLGLAFSFAPALAPKRRAPSPSIALTELGKRYLWWNIPGISHGDDRVIAQVMDIGTYEDAKTLEAEVGHIRMRQVLSHASPGWFSPKSWHYWHLVLGQSEFEKIPPQPRRGDAIQAEFQNAAKKPAKSMAPSRSR